MDQATRAAELARLSEWVARVLLPGYRVEPPLAAVLAGAPARGVGAGDRLGRVAPGVRPQGARAGGRARLAQPLATPAPWSAPSAPCPGVRTASASWPPARRPGIPRSAVQAQLCARTPRARQAGGSSCAWLLSDTARSLVIVGRLE